MEQNYLTYQTGCLLPCRYKEYQTVDAPLDIDDKYRILKLIRSTKTVLVKTEHILYPFSSFLAEFRGALGLFLGFFFMMVWDWLQFAINAIARKKNTLCRIKRPRLKTV